MDASTPEEWYKGLPILTRIGLTAVLVTTVLVQHLGLLDPMLIILNWPLVYEKLQLWRLLTCTLFWGKFSFGLIFQFYFFTKFSSDLEKNEAFPTTGDYLFFLLVEMLLIDVISMLLFFPDGLPLTGPALVFAIIYYWSRREPYAQLQIYFFKIQGYQLPFFIMAMNILFGSDIWTELIGLAAGHLWYFCKEVVPAEYGRTIIKTPEFLITFMARHTGAAAVRPGATVGGVATAGGGGGGGAPPPQPPRFGGHGHRLGGN